MQLLSRLLLTEVGVEIVVRREADSAANDNPNEPDADDL
jgi:hypothetical protein